MAASLRATPAGLDLVDKARIRKGWNKQSTMWCIEASVGCSTLKRFWKPDKYAISHDAFVSIVTAIGEDWQEVAGLTDEAVALPVTPVPESPTLILHEMPEPTEIYGRDEELQQLTNLVTQSRLVFLWGMGGIGKTALASQLVEQLAYDDRFQVAPFDRIIWRSLNAGSNLDRFWTQLDLDLGIVPQVDLRHARYDWTDVSRLIEKFQVERTLVVIDVVESNPVDRAEDIPAWEPADRARYCEWFAQLSCPKHNSCILVLSREHSDEVRRLEGSRPAIRNFKLEGLKLGGIQLFKQYDLKPEPDAWVALIKFYGGNPYALTMIATIIKDQFAGSAEALLNMGTFVLGNMEYVIAERIRHISPEEKLLLTALARLQDPCDRPTLWSQLQSQVLQPSFSQSTLIGAIASLDRKCLVEILTEQEKVLFTLQPMVMKYVRRHWA
jgi:AAA ATPase domain